MCVYLCSCVFAALVCVFFLLILLLGMMFYMFISSDMVKPVDVVNNYTCYRNLTLLGWTVLSLNVCFTECQLKEFPFHSGLQ